MDKMDKFLEYTAGIIIGLVVLVVLSIFGLVVIANVCLWGTIFNTAPGFC